MARDPAGTRKSFDYYYDPFSVQDNNCWNHFACDADGIDGRETCGGGSAWDGFNILTFYERDLLYAEYQDKFKAQRAKGKFNAGCPRFSCGLWTRALDEDEFGIIYSGLLILQSKASFQAQYAATWTAAYLRSGLFAVNPRMTRDAIFVSDTQNHIVWVNPNIEKRWFPGMGSSVERAYRLAHEAGHFFHSHLVGTTATRCEADTFAERATGYDFGFSCPKCGRMKAKQRRASTIWLFVVAQLLGIACHAGRPEGDRCLDPVLQMAVADAFREPIDTTLARQVWGVLIDFEGRYRDWEQRHEAPLDFGARLEILTGRWRHVLVRIATRRVDLAGLHPMFGPVGAAGLLLLTYPEGIVVADSGLAFLAGEIVAQEKITDSMLGALYVLTEGAEFDSGARLARELPGVRAVLCVVAREPHEVEWSDTVAAFVEYLVPSLLLLLETKDAHWREADSDSVVRAWPDTASTGPIDARLGELRRRSSVWRTGQRRSDLRPD